jgi:ABC-type transporter Mla subunit MlaD
MNGMDMMFSRLIGMSPSEIKVAADKTMSLIEAAAKDMSETKTALQRIEEKLDDLIEEKGTTLNGTRKLTSRVNNRADDNNF